MKKSIIYLLILALSINLLGADYTTSSSDWELGSTWNKGVEPTTEDTLTISNGHNVTISDVINYYTPLVLIIDNSSITFDGKLHLPSGSKIVLINGAIITNGSGNSDKIKIGESIVWSGNDGDYYGSFEIGDDYSLPVDWLYINISSKYQKVNVDWATTTEINNDYFSIEYSQDLEDWSEICSVNSIENTSYVTTKYSKSFNVDKSGQMYFRIKQTDFDGTDSYSKVVPHKINKRKEYIMYYVDFNGQESDSQPIGISIAVYSNGANKKLFR